MGIISLNIKAKLLCIRYYFSYSFEFEAGKLKWNKFEYEGFHWIHEGNFQFRTFMYVVFDKNDLTLKTDL